MTKKFRKATRADFERFKKLIEVDQTGCWDWQGPKDSRGYALFRFNGKTVRAAKWIMEQIRGRNIIKMHTHHNKCRNLGCVNPRHLEVLHAKIHAGVHAREISRINSGVNNPNAKLTPKDVQVIRKLGEEHELRLAAKTAVQTFNISIRNAYKILSGETWQ